ncbi:hypothetical protein BJ878DRAFT_546853 [Calycina marina]|uniref:Uncharacterized protein n=1 Tax=Calycina marina TaxID=1763456 RepID=A0A9P7YTY9_9HELO|nr:hypothetical protein BJ878DRAFT_546853 [Calycina marina]
MAGQTSAFGGENPPGERAFALPLKQAKEKHKIGMKKQDLELDLLKSKLDQVRQGGGAPQASAGTSKDPDNDYDEKAHAGYFLEVRTGEHHIRAVRLCF